MLGASKLYDMNALGVTRLFTKGTNVNLRSEPNTASKIMATVSANGTEIGTYTRYYVNDNAYKWHEFSGDKYGTGWIRNDLVTMSVASSTTTAKSNDDAEAQKICDNIAAQDVEVLNNLEVAAATIEKLKAKGINTTTHTKVLNDVFARVQNRQADMNNPSKIGAWGRVSNTIGNAWSNVKNFFGFSGIASLTVFIVVAVVAVVVGAGGAALITLKPWKGQSDIDLKESKELKSLLENADPDIATKVREDLKGQLQDAYALGKRQGSFSGFMSIGKYIIAGGLALWLLPKVLDYFDDVKKNVRRINN